VDEFSAVWRARELLGAACVSSIPVDVTLYVNRVGGMVRLLDLPPDQPGYSTEIAGRLCIVVNQNDLRGRRRFTVCHEIGHKVLNLPSEHAVGSDDNYSKRPWNEILCDVFAAELVLPYQHFKPMVDLADIGFAALDKLASTFEASVTSTGSRFATASELPCAFVLSQNGIIRYVSKSKALREAKAWIRLAAAVPIGSSASLTHPNHSDRLNEIAADRWFADWHRGSTLLEESRHLVKWNQCLTLIWFDEDEVPGSELGADAEDDEPILRELDGVLPWPGKSRRRR